MLMHGHKAFLHFSTDSDFRSKIQCAGSAFVRSLRRTEVSDFLISNLEGWTIVEFRAGRKEEYGRRADRQKILESGQRTALEAVAAARARLGSRNNGLGMTRSDCATCMATSAEGLLKQALKG